MNKFIMLCGLPGSGKSTLARSALFTEGNGTVYLNSDDIREELFGSKNHQKEAWRVSGLMLVRTENALRNGNDVIYDACNLSSKRRIRLLEALKNFDCQKECIICAAPYDVCIKRICTSTNKSARRIITRMYKCFNTPAYFEGWDRISIYYSEGSRGILGSWSAYADKYMTFSQDSSHHTETLGRHLKETVGYIVNTEGVPATDNLAIAAAIHDCGKPFTKDFTDSKGLACKDAHYYQHQCVGAYDALFFDYGDKKETDILDISLYISLHMDPLSWDSPSTGQKCRKLWGEELYNRVLLLHTADLAASHARE